jgi:hypothetical protein
MNPTDNDTLALLGIAISVASFVITVFGIGLAIGLAL